MCIVFYQLFIRYENANSFLQKDSANIEMGAVHLFCSLIVLMFNQLGSVLSIPIYSFVWVNLKGGVHEIWN